MGWDLKDDTEEAGYREEMTESHEDNPSFLTLGTYLFFLSRTGSNSYSFDL